MQDQGQVDRSLVLVADELRRFQAQCIGDLAKNEQRSIAGAPLQLGQVALRNARRLEKRLARHAAARAAPAARARPPV